VPKEALQVFHKRVVPKHGKTRFFQKHFPKFTFHAKKESARLGPDLTPGGNVLEGWVSNKIFYIHIKQNVCTSFKPKLLD